MLKPILISSAVALLVSFSANAENIHFPEEIRTTASGR